MTETTAADYELKPRFTIVEKIWHDIFTDGELLRFNDLCDEEGLMLMNVDTYGLNIISVPSEELLGYVPGSSTDKDGSILPDPDGFVAENGAIITVNYGIVALGLNPEGKWIFSLVLLANDVPDGVPENIAVLLTPMSKVGCLLENGEFVKDPRQMMAGISYSFDIPDVNFEGMSTGNPDNRVEYVFGTAVSKGEYPASFNDTTTSATVLELVTYNKILNCLQYHYTEVLNELGDDNIGLVLSYIPETFVDDDCHHWLQTNYITKRIELDVLTYDAGEHAKAKEGFIDEDDFDESDEYED